MFEQGSELRPLKVLPYVAAWGSCTPPRKPPIPVAVASSEPSDKEADDDSDATSTAVESAGGSAEAPSPGAPSSLPATASPPAPSNGTRHGQAADREAPTQVMAPTAPPPRGRPDLTLGLRAGLAFGGDTLATATVSDGSDQSLDAGSGFLLSLGAMATPLWLTDQVGVGAGIELGLRYNSIGASNGSIVLHSYPVVVLAQMTMRVGDRLYVVPQVGLVKELGVNLSGSGIADGLAVDLTSSVGPVVGLGLLWCFSPHLAFDVTVRYQHLDYSRGDAKADASGVLLTATGHFLP